VISVKWFGMNVADHIAAFKRSDWGGQSDSSSWGAGSERSKRCSSKRVGSIVITGVV
jgi:hypothetical protein